MVVVVFVCLLFFFLIGNCVCGALVCMYVY